MEQTCIHYENLTYYECRTCDIYHENGCIHYTYGRGKEFNSRKECPDISYMIYRNDNRIRKNHKILDIIRKWNDGMVI